MVSGANSSFFRHWRMLKKTIPQGNKLQCSAKRSDFAPADASPMANYFGTWSPFSFYQAASLSPRNQPLQDHLSLIRIENNNQRWLSSLVINQPEFHELGKRRRVGR